MVDSADIPLTAIILTQDEASNIARCLQGLSRVNDVVVVDSGSTDETLSVASEVRGDVRVYTHPFQDFGDQRNWALDHSDPQHDWVLFVDADEFCGPEFMDELSRFVAEPGEFAGAYVAGRNYFLGRWLKRSTMFPSYQLRLLKRGAVRFQKEGHGQREVTDGPLYYLKTGWRHESFSKGIHQWVERHNQYSTDEVELLIRLREEPLKPMDMLSADPIRRRRAFKRLAARLPLRPFNRFVFTYIFRGGFLDGSAGLRYCLLRVAHDIHLMSKLKEREYLAEMDESVVQPNRESET